ncbi:MAG: hypothetical protein ACK55I_03130, partial [bacterium]
MPGSYAGCIASNLRDSNAMASGPITHCPIHISMHFSTDVSFESPSVGSWAHTHITKNDKGVTKRTRASHRIRQRNGTALRGARQLGAHLAWHMAGRKQVK